MSRGTGFRVLCPGKPDWGLGQVLSDDGGARVDVFFLRAGKWTLDTTSIDLELMTGEASRSPILDIAGQADWQHAHHHLYVVELKPQVFSLERKFREANPGYIPGTKPCVYVGMTGLTPAERLREHRRGNHPARFVKKYGVCLLPRLYRRFNPLPYQLAAAMEVELARQLREQGYGVWQN